MASDEEIAHYRKEYAAKSDQTLLQITHKVNPYFPQHIAAKQLLEGRRLKLEVDIHGKLTGIDTRLVAVEAAAKRPEYKTIALWVGLSGVIIAIVALCVSFLAWQRPKEPSANGQSKPMPSSGKSDVHLVPSASESKPDPKAPAPTPAQQLPPSPTKGAPADKKPAKPNGP